MCHMLGGGATGILRGGHLPLCAPWIKPLCLPGRPHSPFTSEIPRVSMEATDMAVQCASFWPQQCPMYVHLELGEGQIYSCLTRPVIRYNSGSDRRDEVGPQLVDYQSGSTQWKSSGDHSEQPHCLDAGLGCVHGAGREVWAILNGPLCIMDKLSGCNLLQLEARSNSMGSGCTVSPMEGVQPVYVSPICTDSTFSEQTKGGGDLSTTYCASMAEPGWVPTVIEVTGGHSQQKLHTSVHGECGVAGVLEGAPMPSEQYIGIFLEQFQAGKQYRVINSVQPFP